MTIPSFIKVRQSYLPADRSAAGLGGRIVSGTAWAVGGTAAGALLQLVSSMIYARLLTPVDFGLMAWAGVIAQFIFLFTNFGFNVSLVQRTTLDTEELSTVWWGNIVIDWSAALLCGVVALFADRISSDPDIPILLVMLGIQFAFSAIGAVNDALMLRQFMFREQAFNNFAGNLAAVVVAVTLLYTTDVGVYALLIGGTIGTIVTTICRFLWVPWLPSLIFSWTTFRRQVAFGSSLLGAMLIGYANGNLDKATIGSLLDKKQLGYFEYAGAIPTQIASQMGTLLNRALFPALATLQADVVEFRRVLLRYLRMTSLLVYPMLIGLGLVADAFVSVAYGDQWTPIVAPMRALCVMGLFSVLAGSLIMVCNAIGKPQLAFKTSVVLFPVNAIATVVAVVTGGLLGAAISRVLVPVVTVALLWRWLGSFIPITLRDLGVAVTPAVSGCVGMAVVLITLESIWAPLGVGPLPYLSAQVVLGAVSYVATIAIGWPEEIYTVVDSARSFAGIGQHS